MKNYIPSQEIAQCINALAGGFDRLFDGVNKAGMLSRLRRRSTLETGGHIAIGPSILPSDNSPLPAGEKIHGPLLFILTAPYMCSVG